VSNGTVAARSTRALLPDFIEAVNLFKPRSFALDNLPKILGTSAPKEWWQAQLPKYHLTFIVMLNWDYGTPQRRERLWVVGIRKPGKPFVFTPPRTRLAGPTTALEAFEGLGWEPVDRHPRHGPRPRRTTEPTHRRLSHDDPWT
jgi:site-specific DNA-cytosine methylase